MSDINGWSNWVTWHIALLADHDRGCNAAVKPVVRQYAELKAAGEDYDPAAAAADVRAALESAGAVAITKNTRRCSARAINWQEISENMINEEAREIEYQNKVDELGELPQDDDYLISNGRGSSYNVSQYGRFLFSGDWDAVILRIAEHKEAEKFWPNVWYIGERGDQNLLDASGNYVK